MLALPLSDIGKGRVKKEAQDSTGHLKRDAYV